MIGQLGLDETKADYIWNIMVDKNAEDIEYSMLIAATIILEENIDSQASVLFREIDCEDSSSIDADEFYNQMTSKNCKITKEKVDQAFMQADEDESGELDFDEFKKLFLETFVIDFSDP